MEVETNRATPLPSKTLTSLDPLPPADDPARVVWEFVRKLDLSEY